MTAAGSGTNATRVVSLLPSATEILCAIGARDLLVGRSHECDFPAGLDDVPVLTGQRTTFTTSADVDRQVRQALAPARGDEASVPHGGADDPDPTGTDATTANASLYTLDADRLATLRPDVILTQDLCEVCSIDLGTVRGVAAELERAHGTRPEIVSLDPKRVEDLFDDVLRVGEAVGRERDAHAAMIDLRGRYWTAVDYVNPYVPVGEVAFLEWMDPLFVGGHWTPAMIEHAGGKHPLNEAGTKSRQVAPEDLLETMPGRLVICPCGLDLEQIERELPALEQQRWWNLIPAVQDHERGCALLDAKVVLVDGSAMFNRPGPRLVDAFRFLVAWLQGREEVMPEDFPARAL